MDRQPLTQFRVGEDYPCMNPNLPFSYDNDRYREKKLFQENEFENPKAKWGS